VQFIMVIEVEKETFLECDRLQVCADHPAMR
jgi:hypothetical protein